MANTLVKKKPAASRTSQLKTSRTTKSKSSRLAAARTTAGKPRAQQAASRTADRGNRKKYVYFFGNGKADGDRTMKDLLGGKGSGLAEMTNAGLPVPPGFTISTEACTLYYEQRRKTPDFVDAETVENLRRLEKATGVRLGDASNPLLVSVRSGAKFSMPGMMDTILNLGTNDHTVEGIKARTGNPSPAISARPEPLPPSRSFWSPRPSAVPPPKA